MQSKSTTQTKHNTHISNLSILAISELIRYNMNNSIIYLGILFCWITDRLDAEERRKVKF